MRLILLCGSLNPGNDGVGDYTRNLACEFLKTGHQVEIIAINEKHLGKSEFNSIQECKHVAILTHRVSEKLTWKKRKAYITGIISNFNPDIISLQFVPFSFHDKGLPYFLPSWLSGLENKSVKWHFMFHELWVADSKTNSIKEWLHRELQKIIIKNLLHLFKNAWIDTSNQTFYNMLKRYKFIVGLLPIFSNLPKGEKIILPKILNRENKVVGVFFGNLHENLCFIDKIKFLKDDIATQMSKQFVIFHIGNNNNPRTRQLLANLSDDLNIPTYSFGYLDAQEAANILYNSDLGLSNYSDILVQKSGSIASMLYNELPVILLSDSNLPSQLSRHPEIAQLNANLDLKMFINQNTCFSSKYDPCFTAQKLEQKFLSN